MLGTMFIIFVVCMILAIPVGFSIAISATAYLVFGNGIPVYSVIQMTENIATSSAHLKTEPNT